jgi:hypothetical protein
MVNEYPDALILSTLSNAVSGNHGELSDDDVPAFDQS